MPNRYQVEQFDASSWQVTDTKLGVEICAVSDFEHSDLRETNDAKARAQAIAEALNAAAWQYSPVYKSGL